ncbi:MAG TPA: hypothetical protein VH105_02085 [Burkholderiales bacterium]|jgi:hypothetical protein|nr:hypothetical protein [Burkholderiales bacterium]
MSQLSKAVKYIALSSLLAFAAGAYAGTDDGNLTGNGGPSQQTPANSSQQPR